LQEEGRNVSKAAISCGITRSSAYELRKESNSSDRTTLPGKVRNATKNKTKKRLPEHTQFLIKLFDENPCTTVKAAREGSYGLTKNPYQACMSM
jgi:hypothetical protein